MLKRAELQQKSVGSSKAPEVVAQAEPSRSGNPSGSRKFNQVIFSFVRPEAVAVDQTGFSGCIPAETIRHNAAKIVKRTIITSAIVGH